MKKFLIYTGYTLASLLIICYLTFLIAPPVINKFYDFDKFKPEIKKIVLENSKLNLDYQKIKIYSTPLLSLGISIDGIKIDLPDNSNLLKIQKLKGGLSLLNLFILEAKTSGVEVIEPNINLEIKNNEQYKIVSLVEDIINENNKKPKVEPAPVSPFVQKLMKVVRVNVSNIKITNYNLNVTDNKNNLILKGEKLNLGYYTTLEGKNQRAKLNTVANLFSNNKQNILADLKIKIDLPDSTNAPKEEIDPDEIIKIPFINLIEIYQTYDLNLNTIARLNLKKDGIFGYLNVDYLNLKLSSIRLPDSYLHTKFKGKQIEYDSNIFVKENEKIALLGDIKLGKHPHLNCDIKSDKIYFSHMLDLLEGLLDSLSINNDIKKISSTGYLEANTLIKTNFKKLKSNGSIIVKNGSFLNNNIGIKNLNSTLLFDDNELNIKETNADINNAKINLTGTIDQKADAKINLDIDNLSIPYLYQIFAPKELKNLYTINSALLNLDADIVGKLDNLNAKLNMGLNNLNLNDTKKTMFIANKNLTVNLNADKEMFLGTINNSGFIFNMPSIKTTASINSININLDKNDIKINPFDVIYNKLSKINIQGDIKNYSKEPDINIFVDGFLSTQNLKQTLGKEISYYLISKGNIPLKAKITGNSKKQEILGQIYSNQNNFITPVDLKELTGAQSIIQGDITLKGNKIRIKNSGLFKAKSFSNDLKSNIAHEIASLTAIIDNNHINLFRFSIPKEENAKIAIFRNSSFKTKGKIIAAGDVDNLHLKGDFEINDLTIPEILFGAKKINLDITSKYLNADAKKINLNGSNIDGGLKVDLTNFNLITIKDILVKSDYIDVDKALVVSEKLMKYMPPVVPSNNSKGQAQDIPILADGKINLKKIKTGLIIIDNIKNNLLVQKNNLIIKNLSCNGFKGSIDGDIKMNLISGLLDIKLKGKNVDVDDLMKNAAGLKDTISGTAEFKTDISLKGNTYLEQVKSLKGNVQFKVKNGVYGPFAKLENFFLAENIRENPIFKNTIGAILSPLTTIDSTHFEELVGSLDFKNGTVYLNPITSKGDILCILIKGNMNLVNNTMNSFVRVRLASAVSDLLGPLAIANPVNLIKNTPGLNIMTAKLFVFFTTVVQESEYKEIPDFSAKHSDNNATKFQIVLNGDVNKPLKLVKSFKWLALEKDMELATEFSNNYVAQEEQRMKQELINKLQKEYENDNKFKVGVEKILKMDTTAPKVKEMLVDEVLKNANTVQNKIQTKADEIQVKNQQNSIKMQEAIQKLQNQTNKNQQKIKDFETNLQTNIQNKIQEKIKSAPNNSDIPVGGRKADDARDI